MKLNRNNYEEYFILYLDNELDSEGRGEVEAFVKQHPDLKAELDMLMQSKLTPDTETRFADKGSLMRFDSSSISLSNYEEWLTSYIDDELTEGERNDVEIFVAGNPAIQRELNLLQQTKLQPEAIVFPYKESLYKKEEKARVIAIRWWRIAAAAVLLLGISTTALILVNKNNKGDDVGPQAANGSVKSPVTNDTKDKNEAQVKVEQPKELTPEKEGIVVRNNQPSNGTQAKDKNSSLVVKSNNNKQVEKKVNDVPEKEQPLIANIPDQKPNSNNIVQSGKQPSDVVATGNDTQSGLTNVDGKSDKIGVTPDPLDPSNKSNGLIKQEPNPEAHFASETNANKGIRGFLRKVTRTFEKRTNIKATDEDDRLLVAGLAIKL